MKDHSKPTIFRICTVSSVSLIVHRVIAHYYADIAGNVTHLVGTYYRTRRRLIGQQTKEIPDMPKTPQREMMPRPDPDFRYKQCLILRNDVKMSCGKRCAQAAHASIGAYNNADKSLQKAWISEGQKKVVLRSDDERTLYELKVIAERSGVSTSLIQDAGMTEIPPGTITALGLGPAKTEELDKITGTLSLL
jgi:PTH2 family peptidyl-tRNA hydrolase